MSMPRHVIVTIEAEFPLGEDVQVHDLADRVREVVSATRMYGAGRATAVRFLDSEDEYDKWYRAPSVGEFAIPVVTHQEVVFD